MTTYRFSQVDVFTDRDLYGNPVAVVHDADDMDDDTMARFARWTNLSETTFICAPTHDDADYLLRIFTPGGELPFAGHPTLGSCRAWLDKGGVPKSHEHIVQQCGIGNVIIKQHEQQLGFSAPDLIRSGPLESEVLESICAALNISPSDILAHQWTVNGPEWASILLRDAQFVRSLTPNFNAMGDFKIGVIGAEHDKRRGVDYEVRAFVPGIGVPEDPVTGSLNAGIAKWLIDAGIAPDNYIVAQGSVLQRAGRITIRKEGDHIWVLGNTRLCIDGKVELN